MREKNWNLGVRKFLYIRYLRYELDHKDFPSKFTKEIQHLKMKFLNVVYFIGLISCITKYTTLRFSLQFISYGYF